MRQTRSDASKKAQSLEGADEMQEEMPNSNGDTGVGPDRGSPPSTPRWVKVFGIVVIALVLLVVIIMFTGIGGEHGPGRHMSGSGQTPPASSTVNSVQQP